MRYPDEQNINMSLLIIIAIVCLFINLSHDIFKLLRISNLFVPKRKPEDAALEAELEKAKENLIAVKNGPSSGEYALLIKTMRAERKIKDIEEKMKGDRNTQLITTISIDLIGGYVLKVLLSLVLIVISISNRYTPVIVFGDWLNFTPLFAVLSYPTGVHNAVSVPVWALSCNLSMNKIVSLLKRRKKMSAKRAGTFNSISN